MTHSPSTCSPQPGDKVCWNCKTTQSPLWRKFSPTTETPEACTPSTPSTTYLCNKCGLFFKRNKKQRPLELDGVSSGDSSPSIASSPKKKKSNSTSTAPQQQPKRRQSASELPTVVSSPVPSPKVEEKKKRKRTTTNASVTCLPTSISSIFSDNKNSQQINSPVPSTQQTLANQYLPAKRRLLSPPESVSTQQTLENLYSTAPSTMNNIQNNNTTCNITNNTPGICSEDLDALIREPSKKTKQTSNTTYRGFGSPIIHSYSSGGATFNTPTNAPPTHFNTHLTFSDANALAQIFSLYFQQQQLQQPQTNVNYTTPSTQMYNTFAFASNITESTNTYPHHIVDWYSNENEACTINPLSDNCSDFFNNDQFLSEQDLFGEEPNKM